MHSGPTVSIRELIALEEIQQAERDLEELLGRKPENVSGWDCGSEFQRKLNEHLKMPQNNSPFHYYYPEDISTTESVRRRLDNGVSAQTATLAPTGTDCVLLSLLALKWQGVKTVLLFNPCYFTVKPWLETLGMTCVEVDLAATTAGADIPEDYSSLPHADAFWATQPAYTMGLRLGPRMTALLEAEGGGKKPIVLDATLLPSWQDKNVANHLENVISFHTPHKLLSTNAQKFSCLIYPERYSRFLYRWTAPVFGSLPASALAAAEHFLSANWQECETFVRAFLHDAIRRIDVWTNNYRGLDITADESSIFVPLHLASLSKQLEEDDERIKAIIRQSNVSFFPLSRSNYFNRSSFGMRLNILKTDAQFFNNLDRLMTTLL